MGGRAVQDLSCAKYSSGYRRLPSGAVRRLTTESLLIQARRTVPLSRHAHENWTLSCANGSIGCWYYRRCATVVIWIPGLSRSTSTLSVSKVFVVGNNIAEDSWKESASSLARIANALIMRQEPGSVDLAGQLSKARLWELLTLKHSKLQRLFKDLILLVLAAKQLWQRARAQDANATCCKWNTVFNIFFAMK